MWMWRKFTSSIASGTTGFWWQLQAQYICECFGVERWKTMAYADCIMCAIVGLNHQDPTHTTPLPPSLAPASSGVIQCVAMPGREPELCGFARMVGGGARIPGVPGVLLPHKLMYGKLCTYFQRMVWICTAWLKMICCVYMCVFCSIGINGGSCFAHGQHS